MRDFDMGRREYLITLGGSCLAPSVAGCIAGDGDQAGGATWEIGTPGEGSINNIIAQAYAQILNEQESELQLDIGNYSASEESIRLLGRGDIELATAASMIGAAAYHSMDTAELNFSGDRSVDLKPLQAFVHTDLRFWWITLDDSLETVADLSGRPVSVGPVGAQYMFGTILSEIGMMDEVEHSNHEWDDMPFALREGRVDAIGAYASLGHSPPGWHTPLEGEEVTILEYTSEQEQLLQESSLLSTGPVQINDIYDTDVGREEIVGAVNPFETVISQEADEDLAYELTEQIFENYEDVQDFAAAFEEFTPEYAVDALSPDVPVHPGIAQYYKDEGFWDDSLEEFSG